jgi:hypothetical protein
LGIISKEDNHKMCPNWVNAKIALSAANTKQMITGVIPKKQILPKNVKRGVVLDDLVFLSHFLKYSNFVIAFSRSH